MYVGFWADGSNGCIESHGSCNMRNISCSTDLFGKIPLPVFGLASYKFKESIWTRNALYEQQLESSLLQSADRWLDHLRVHHPDYRFFLSHYNSSGRWWFQSSVLASFWSNGVSIPPLVLKFWLQTPPLYCPLPFDPILQGIGSAYFSNHSLYMPPSYNG